MNKKNEISHFGIFHFITWWILHGQYAAIAPDLRKGGSEFRFEKTHHSVHTETGAEFAKAYQSAQTKVEEFKWKIFTKNPPFPLLKKGE